MRSNFCTKDKHCNTYWPPFQYSTGHTERKIIWKLKSLYNLRLIACILEMYNLIKLHKEIHQKIYVHTCICTYLMPYYWFVSFPDVLKIVLPVLLNTVLKLLPYWNFKIYWFLCFFLFYEDITIVFFYYIFHNLRCSFNFRLLNKKYTTQLNSQLFDKLSTFCNHSQ